jgi:hypothetical protein
LYYGLDGGAAIELATNFMGSVDEPRHIIDGGNLFLLEQRHKLVILAWVGACCARADYCGRQHHRSANQRVWDSGDADAHGRIPFLRCHGSTPHRIDIKR